MKSTNIFNTFQDCLAGRVFPENQEFNSFMFCRYLGNSPKMIFYANFLNCYEIPNKSQYKFIQSIKNKPYSIKWIKIPKQETKDLENKDYEKIMQKYKISYSKAYDYLKILKRI